MSEITIEVGPDTVTIAKDLNEADRTKAIFVELMKREPREDLRKGLLNWERAALAAKSVQAPGLPDYVAIFKHVAPARAQTALNEQAFRRLLEFELTKGVPSEARVRELVKKTVGESTPTPTPSQDGLGRQGPRSVPAVTAQQRWPSLQAEATRRGLRGDEALALAAGALEMLIAGETGRANGRALDDRKVAYLVEVAVESTLQHMASRILPEAAKPTDAAPPGDSPGTPPALAVAGDQKVSDTALNGAQVASLLEVLQSVANGLLPRESGVALITASFPVSPADAERMMGSIGRDFVPGSPATVVQASKGSMTFVRPHPRGRRAGAERV